jgi:LmbE family N-acetylglucosaminyl deacetylase
VSAIVPGRLAVVVAHPDDDTYACAATVARHAADPRFRFVLVHATSGEAGEISDPSLATRETLGAVREAEDRRSWITLGREPDRHDWLRYPDGGLASVPFEDLVGAIESILSEERPDVVLTFGLDGITGHPDHIVTGAATTLAFHRLRERGGEGFHRLLWGAVPQSTVDEWNRQLVDQGKEPFDPTRMYHPRGVPDGVIGFRGEFETEIATRVVAALREHLTQAGDLDTMPEDQRIESVRHERAIVAWPRWQAGDPVLSDVFDDL